MSNALKISCELEVPKKVLPAFQSSILPRAEASVLDKPTTVFGKAKRLFLKSTFTTGVTAIFGSIALDEFIDTTLQFATPGVDLTATLGVTGIMLGGFALTALGAISIAKGDCAYAPLPASKEYLELEKTNMKTMIAPFKTWDNMFDKSSVITSN